MISIVGSPQYLRWDYNEGSGSGSGSLISDSFLKGNKNDFILFQVVISISRTAIAKDIDGSRIQFVVAGFANPNEVIQSQNTTAFKEFQTGDKIDITATNGGTNNRVSKTITKIDDQTIRCVGETFSAFLEIAAIIIDKQPVTDIQFLYNLIENSEAINYTSKVDGVSDCSYKSAAGILDANDLITIRELIGQGSKSWQYGFIDEVTVQGKGAFGSGSSDAYSQYFKIEQRFYIHPFYLDQSWSDILLNNLESYFVGNKCLKHIFKVIASTGLADPNKTQTGEFANILGNTGGFDENFNNNPTNYSITPIQYQWNSINYSQLKLLSAVEYGIAPFVSFSFQLKNTTDAPFTSNTKLNVNFNLACDIADQLKTLNIFENFCFDSVDLDHTPGTSDGFQLGTDQQVFRGLFSGDGVVTVLTSSSIITIQGIIILTPAKRARILTLANKRYELTVSLYGSDGVTLLVDANDFLIETKDPGAVIVGSPSFAKLDTLFPNNLRALPTSEIVATTDIAVDLTNYAPSDIEFVQSRMKVIALKGDGTSFILDEIDYDFGTNVISAGRVLINYITNRLFKLLSSDKFNQIAIFNNGDVGSVHHYSFLFPFMCRWEYWKALIAAIDFYDNTKANNNLNDYWFHYQTIEQQGSGSGSGDEINEWGIYVKQELDVNLKGNLVTYSNQKLLTCKDYNSNPYWDVSRKIQVFDLNGTEIVNAGTSFCYSDEDVRIIATFETSLTLAQLSGEGSGSGSDTMDGIIRLEPFEAGGTTAIMEADTVNPIAAIACFKPLLGQTKVKKTAVTNKKITFEILTDHTKIPAGTKLTCYAEIMAGEYSSPSTNATSLFWHIIHTSGVGTCGIVDNPLTKTYGCADWTTDLNTTMALLVTSINTNTNEGTLGPIGGATFDNSAGFTASWDIPSQIFTLYVPAGSGSFWNGKKMQFAIGGGVWGGDAGNIETFPNGSTGGLYTEDCTKKDLTIFAKYADVVPPKPASLSTLNLCGDWIMTVLATGSQSSGSGSGNATGPESDVNDYAGIIFKCSAGILSATLTLQKLDCNANILSVYNLNDHTYGTFYGFGFITDDKSNNYIGYKIQWGNVLALLGEGIYKVICTKNQIFGGTIDIDWIIPYYCLKTYSAANAQGTVLIEMITTELQVDLLNPSLWFYYGQFGWRNSVRLNGIFGYDNYTETREFDEYRSGERKWIMDEQAKKYELHLRAFPGWLHNILANWILQADSKFITDYNRYNAFDHIQTQVISDGDWQPDNDNWKFNQNKKRPVILKYMDAFNNRRKKRIGTQPGFASGGSGGSGGSFDDSFDDSFDGA